MLLVLLLLLLLFWLLLLLLLLRDVRLLGRVCRGVQHGGWPSHVPSTLLDALDALNPLNRPKPLPEFAFESPVGRLLGARKKPPRLVQQGC